MTELHKAAKSLEKRHFTVRCLKSKADALNAILQLIPKDASVGAGGSVTLNQIGIIEALYERGNPVYQADLARKLGKDPNEARKRGMTADYYLTSSNAVTLNGELVNTDGSGNRVAAMFYGPDTVIVVAGRNKIVKNRSAAIARIKNTASPLNTKRLNKDTPCSRTGKCGDCDSPDRICRITTIIEYALLGKQMHVFLVDEDLGY